jgi:hypothetical protein
MSEAYKDLGGNPSPVIRECSPYCDGMGMDKREDPRIRHFIECPVHRPAPTHRGRKRWVRV